MYELGVIGDVKCKIDVVLEDALDEIMVLKLFAQLTKTKMTHKDVRLPRGNPLVN